VARPASLIVSLLLPFVFKIISPPVPALSIVKSAPENDNIEEFVAVEKYKPLVDVIAIFPVGAPDIVPLFLIHGYAADIINIYKY
jgi:hypothetical protein